MKNQDEKKMEIACKICSMPLNVGRKLAKFRCMCDDEVRIVPLERIYEFEFEHLLDFDSVVQ
jgi:hypothetical protein